MNNWFKFYGVEYLSDPKMLNMTAGERSCWLTLLCYGSLSGDGIVKNITEYQLMRQAGIDENFEEWEFCSGILQKFVEKEMIIIEGNLIKIINWQKRQKPQEGSLTGYERVKLYRQRKRENVNDNESPLSSSKKNNKNIGGNDNATSLSSTLKNVDNKRENRYDNKMITSDALSDNDRIEENRIDQKRKEKKEKERKESFTFSSEQEKKPIKREKLDYSSDSRLNRKETDFPNDWISLREILKKKMEMVDNKFPPA